MFVLLESIPYFCRTSLVLQKYVCALLWGFSQILGLVFEHQWFCIAWEFQYVCCCCCWTDACTCVQCSLRCLFTHYYTHTFVSFSNWGQPSLPRHPILSFLSAEPGWGQCEILGRRPLLIRSSFLTCSVHWHWRLAPGRPGRRGHCGRGRRKQRCRPSAGGAPPIPPQSPGRVSPRAGASTVLLPTVLWARRCLATHPSGGTSLAPAVSRHWAPQLWGGSRRGSHPTATRRALWPPCCMTLGVQPVTSKPLSYPAHQLFLPSAKSTSQLPECLVARLRPNPVNSSGAGFWFVVLVFRLIEG